MQKTLHVVFQTHWDREWYFTFERYRYRLIHVIRRAINALKNDEISYFVLDGQTLPLEDFLEVCEKNDRQDILYYIKEGRMIIGPWFIAMDEYLVHGESIIRNLEIGHEIARTYGNIQKVGYLPDTFGHIGQMPQILNGFSINNAIMWRGVSLDHSEFIWQGVDGSSLFSIFLVEGYYQPLMNQQNYTDDVKNYVHKIEKFALTHDLLLTTGGDHVMPTYDALDQRLEAINKLPEDFKVRVSNYEHYILELKDKLKNVNLQTLKGELRDNKHAYILPNVLSTRSYLKQLNQHIEDQLLGYIEPMMALAYINKDYAPVQYLKSIWRLMLQNQPHDSICGCSIDPVHIENEVRALKVNEMIDSFKEGLFDELQLLPMSFYYPYQKRIDEDDTKFSIYNPHPFPYSGIVEGVIWLSQDMNPDNISLVDDLGNIVELVIGDIDKYRLFVSPLDYPPLFRHGKSYAITVRVHQLKPLTFTNFKVIQGNSISNYKKQQFFIENTFMKIEVKNDGALIIHDKINNQILTQWHQFYSSLDAGDSYNYSKPEQDVVTFAVLEGLPVVYVSELSQVLEYTLILRQPKGLDDTRKKPTTEHVETKIHVQLKLHHNEDLVRVKTTIDQKAKDQRLRIKFPLNVRIDNHVCDSAFELVSRPSNRVEVFETTRLKEVPVVVDPTLSMVYGFKEGKGIRFYHRGIHESQLVEEHSHTTLEMTLIRSVSHLSRDDFRSRGGAAGPNLPTPDAQCIRKHVFEYAFGLVGSYHEPVLCYQEAQLFRKPPVITRAFGEPKKSLIIKDNDGIQMTSLRWVEKNSVEVRLWNPFKEEKSTEISSDFDIKSIIEVTLDHRVKHTHSNTITLKANDIKTFIVTYENR